MLVVASTWTAHVFTRVACRTHLTSVLFPIVHREGQTFLLLYSLSLFGYGFTLECALAVVSIEFAIATILFLFVECPATALGEFHDGAPRFGLRRIVHVQVMQNNQPLVLQIVPQIPPQQQQQQQQQVQQQQQQQQEQQQPPPTQQQQEQQPRILR